MNSVYLTWLCQNSFPQDDHIPCIHNSGCQGLVLLPAFQAVEPNFQIPVDQLIKKIFSALLLFYTIFSDLS
jgi:hypothetical protein